MIEQIGNYKVLERIGIGGMGDVYRGMDVMLEREVAIKLLRPELNQREDLINRFRSEAVAMGRLSHPNIAMVYNFLFENGQYFLVMEFVRGNTLDILIQQRGALPYNEAIPLLCMILDGLEHAHKSSIVHRDIKPSNIMLTDDGLKLMDFGIARILQQSRQTRSGHMVGTLEYMSPEHIQGKDTDARTDIYSVGIVAYEMLTGDLPFRKETDYEMIKSQVEEKPKSLRSLNSSIPESVEKCVNKALEKNCTNRYASAREFGESLQVALSASPATPRTGRTFSPSVLIGAKDGLSFNKKLAIWSICGILAGSGVLWGALTYLDRDKNGNGILQKSSNPTAAEPGGKISMVGSGSSAIDFLNSRSVAELEGLAKTGDANAAFVLGRKFEAGQDAIQNSSLALKYYVQAAELGHVQAQFVAGVHLLEGSLGKKDLGLAEELLKKATQQKLPDSLEALSACFERQHRYADAIIWFKKLYEEGFKEAAGYVGIEYSNLEDYVSAVPWLEKGSDVDFKEAQFSLGMIYFKGLTQGKDYKKALSYFEKAAKQSQKESLYMLGIMYKDGFGVDKDLEQAQKWFIRADQGGYSQARKELEFLKHFINKQ